MGASVSQIDETAFIDRLASLISCSSNGEELSIALQSEFIRSVIGSDWQASEGRRGTHTLRITDAIRSDLAPTLEILSATHGIERTSEDYTQIIQSLASIGDISTSGQGYWFPNPPTFYAQKPGADVFVFAGAATTTMRPWLGEEFRSLGAARYIPGDYYTRVDGRVDIRINSFDDFLGREAENLSDWTSDFLRRLEGKLSSNNSITIDDIDIYFPEPRVEKNSQLARWVKGEELLTPPSDVRICRGPESKIGERSYFAGRFARGYGRVVLAASIPVTKNDFDRLRFGFDMHHQSPMDVGVSKYESHFELKLWRTLPAPENKVFSLGWKLSDRGSNSPEVWGFPLRLYPFVAHAFKRLGLMI